MRISSLICGVLFLSACAHQEVARVADRGQGEWNTKVLLRDFKKQKSVTLTVDFIAIGQEKLRAEATATLGIAAASFAVDRDYMSLAIHPQKRFYSGKVNEKSLLPFVGFELDPHLLFDVLYDQSPPAENFSCGMDGLGIVAQCRSKNSDLTIQWAERSGNLKRIVMRSVSYELQILVKNYSTKVQKSDDFFRIKAPDTYKKYQLN